MAIAGTIIETIFQTIKNGQERGLKEAEIKATLETTLEGYVTQRIAAVNATMQAEARSDKWLQWAWRPIVGLTFSAVIINNYVLLSYFTWARPIPIDSEVWLAMGAVLGVTAWTRGREKEKREDAHIEAARTAANNAREESRQRFGRMDEMLDQLGGGR